MAFSVRGIVSDAVGNIFAADSGWLRRSAAADFEWHGPSLLGKNGGRNAELLQFVNTLRASLSEFSLTQDDPIVEGLDAAVRWTVRGRHTGMGLGNPSGRAVLFTGIHILRFTEEPGGALKLSRFWQQWGQMGLLQNIELMPFIGGPGTELPGPTVEREDSGGLMGARAEGGGGKDGDDAGKQMIRRLFDDVINHDNLAQTHELIAADIKDHNPGPSDLPGLAGIQQVCKLLRSAFPDLNGTIDAMIAEGDRIAVRWTVRGTNTCGCSGIDATGRAMVGTGIDILRIAARDGRRQVVDRWGNSDDTGILIQLGIISFPP